MFLKFFNKKNLLLIFLSIILVQSGLFMMSKNLENKKNFFKFNYEINDNFNYYFYKKTSGQELKEIHNKSIQYFISKKFNIDKNKINKKKNTFWWYSKKVSVLDKNLFFMELNEFLRLRMIDFLKKKISLNSEIISSVSKYNSEINVSISVQQKIIYEIFLKKIQENENFIKLDNPNLTYQIKKISWKENILISLLFIFVILILLKNKKNIFN